MPDQLVRVVGLAVGDVGRLGLEDLAAQQLGGGAVGHTLERTSSRPWWGRLPVM
jgi:hypothetical protein